MMLDYILFAVAIVVILAISRWCIADTDRQLKQHNQEMARMEADHTRQVREMYQRHGGEQVTPFEDVEPL